MVLKRWFGGDKQPEEKPAPRRPAHPLVHELALRIRGTFDLDEILQLAADAVGEQLGADHCLIYLCDPNKDRLRWRAGYHGSELTPLRLPLKESDFPDLFSQLRQGQSLPISHPLSDPLIARSQSAWASADLRSLVFIPALSDHLEAVLILAEVSQARHRPDEDLRFLEAVAAQVAIACRHSGLTLAMRQAGTEAYSATVELQTENQYLQWLTQLLLFSSTDPTRVLNHISESLAELYNVDVCSIEELQDDMAYVRSIRMAGQTTNMGVFPIEDTPRQQIIVSREKHIITRAMETHPHDRFLWENNLNFFTGVPITSRTGDLIGLLNLFHREAIKLQERDVKLLSAIARRSALELETTERAASPPRGATEDLEIKRRLEFVRESEQEIERASAELRQAEAALHEQRQRLAQMEQDLEQRLAQVAQAEQELHEQRQRLAHQLGTKGAEGSKGLDTPLAPSVPSESPEDRTRIHSLSSILHPLSSIFSDLLGLMEQGSSIEQVCASLVEELIEWLPGASAAIWLVDPGTQNLVQAAGRGAPAKRLMTQGPIPLGPLEKREPGTDREGSEGTEGAKGVSSPFEPSAPFVPKGQRGHGGTGGQPVGTIGQVVNCRETLTIDDLGRPDDVPDDLRALLGPDDLYTSAAIVPIKTWDKTLGALLIFVPGPWSLVPGHLKGAEGLDTPLAPFAPSEPFLPVTKDKGQLTKDKGQTNILPFLEAVACCLGIFIEQSRIRQTVLRYSEELTRMDLDGESIKEPTDLEQICDDILRNVADSLGATHGALFLYDPTEKELRLFRHRGLDKSLTGLHLSLEKFEQSLGGTSREPVTTESAEPLIIADLETDPRINVGRAGSETSREPAPLVSRLLDEGLRSGVVLPLTSGRVKADSGQLLNPIRQPPAASRQPSATGQLIGVLILASREPGGFSHYSSEFLSIITSRIANTICRQPGWRMENGEWKKIEDGEWRMEDGRGIAPDPSSILYPPSSFVETLLDNLQSGVVAVDSDGRITIFNPAMKQLTGYHPEEVLGHLLADCGLQIADWSLVPGPWSLVPGHLKGAEGAEGAEGSKGLDTPFAPFAPFEPFLPVTKDKGQGTNLAELFNSAIRHPPSAISRHPTSVEAQVLTKDGGSRSVSITVHLLRDAQGEPVGAVGLFTDLTEIRALEHERYRADSRSAMIGEMSARLAHEIKNPLASMMSGLELLKRRLKYSDREGRYFDRLIAELQRLDTTVREMLAYSRTAPPTREPVDPKAPAERALDMLAPQLGAAQIEVTRDYQPKLGPVLMDANQIEQAMLNLILNAIQAMPHGGTLKVKLSLVPGPWSLVPGHLKGAEGAEGAEGLDTPLAPFAPSEPFLPVTKDKGQLTKDKGQWIEYSVSDTGCGIAPDVLDKIFVPFFSTKTHGTGLGLASVKKIVEAHQGQIDVQTEPGKGTTFTIRFLVTRDS